VTEKARPFSPGAEERGICRPAELLKVFEKHPTQTFRLRELVVELGLRSSQARELKQALKGLVRGRQIVYLKKNHYALVHKGRHAAAEIVRRESRPASRPRAGEGHNLASGRLIGHRDGYGFVVPDVPLAGTDVDIFVPPDGMGPAMHGDRVEVRVLRGRDAGRFEGRILRVIEHAQKTVVGEFRCGQRDNYVLPFDHRLPLEIVIPRGQEWPARGPEVSSRDRQFGGESDGKRVTPDATARRSVRDLDHCVVDVEITEFPGPASPPRGRVVEILGRRDEFGVDVEIIIRKFHLPHRFPPEVTAAASATPQFISEGERERRRDFRSLPIVTIDGETAKDFDDAVYVERLTSGNYLLHVHIADVAHYVRPGTTLDREARLRGTSVYFPDRAVPMLPLELSNGICSLNPQVDRLAMSVLMEIDGQGRIVEYELVPGIIRSAERMTYTAVRDLLAGEASSCQRYRPLVENFKLMGELAEVLNGHRQRRGSIDFDLPEPVIEFDDLGRMVGITRSERNPAHRLIEEFMLAANESVAGYLEQEGNPSLYRVHEKPDPKKVLEFEEIAATFGYSLGIEMPPARRVRVRAHYERGEKRRLPEHLEVGDLKITPRHYQRLTQRLEGKPEERILSFLMLRSLKQARYSEDNLGHFALAAPTYTHFTSPIRRYPDLIVHRILKAALAAEGGHVRVRPVAADLLVPPGPLEPVPPKSRGTPRSPSVAPGLSPALGGAFVLPQELHALGLETSEAERRAADAERELIEWKKVSFMAQHLGDEFEALLIGLTKHGFFVELTDLFVEGFVPLESLADDRYVYREKHRAIVGQRTGKAYHLGGRLRVRLDRIDRSGNKLQFSVTESAVRLGS
jgi:ribonuclease R